MESSQVECIEVKNKTQAEGGCGEEANGEMWIRGYNFSERQDI
jgi:hypothetical protein